MTTSYPTSLDSLSNPVVSGSQSVDHAQQHANINDCVEAIEAELGTLPKGSYSSVRARLDASDTAITALGLTATNAITNGSITTIKLADANVTAAKMATDSVANTSLQTDSVSTGKIQALAVTGAKIAPNAITATKFDTTIAYRVVCTSITRPTGFAGLEIYETDTLRQLLHDGTGWVCLSEPVVNAGTPSVVSETGIVGALGTRTMFYQRSDGMIRVWGNITIVTNGTGATSIWLTLPVAGSIDVQVIGSYRETTIGGKQGSVTSVSSATSGKFVTYDNLYPAFNNAVLSYSLEYRMTTRYS